MFMDSCSMGWKTWFTSRTDLDHTITCDCRLSSLFSGITPG